MTTSITKLNPEVRPLIPTDYGTAMQMADIMFKSGAMPSTIKNREAVFVAMQMGAGLGLTPMQAVQSIAVINGKPALYGDAMLAIVKASGLLEYIKEEITGKDDNMIATCTVKRKGEQEPVIRTWSVADAKQAGKWGTQGVWSAYAKRMLQMRPRSFALRDTFPDLLLGLAHSVEELSDGSMIDVTPSKPAPTLYENPPVETITVASPIKKDTVVLSGDESAKSIEIPADELFAHIMSLRMDIYSTEDFLRHDAWWRANFPAVKGYFTAAEAKELGDIYFKKKKEYGEKPVAELLNDNVE